MSQEEELTQLLKAAFVNENEYHSLEPLLFAESRVFSTVFSLLFLKFPIISLIFFEFSLVFFENSRNIVKTLVNFIKKTIKDKKERLKAKFLALLVRIY